MESNQDLIIKSNGETIPVEPFDGNVYTLRELQHIVGGFVEIIQLKNGTIMVLNELGKIDGLPYNKVATEMYRDNYRGSYDYIVGDVLICDNKRVL